MIPILVLVAQANLVSTTFQYTAEKPRMKVALAGQFNNWNKDADPMASSDGVHWSKTVNLKPGAYQYKFVLDGETWIADPAGKSVSDGNGNTNSRILVTPPDFALPAKYGDGRITASVLSHSTKVPDLNYDQGKLTITLQARPDDIAHVSVLVNDKTYAMREIGHDEITAKYRAELPWDRKTNLSYNFKLDDGRKVLAFGTKGLTTYSAGNRFQLNAKTFQPFVVPAWVERSVIYQIFPDRFENGDPTNDPANVQKWNAKPTFDNKMGGDFAGVEKHLPYLKNLGISAIYFNPIFQSISNHRYQAIDYYKVDKELGTNQEFIDLTHDLKKAGIKTILDGVFNHTAPEFFAFQDVVKNGAKSKYKDWYTFHGFPVTTNPPNYECWWGSATMPKVHILNPETEAYFLKIPTFWQTNADVAGWRLDVANEVPMDYWRAFRKVVKQKDPNAWILGEEWGNASAWLGGDQWDATMNYQFREAILQLVGKGRDGKPSEMMNRLMNTYASYAPQVSRNLMNLLGSHDTARILTEAGGDKDLAKMAAVIQFTWIGTPSIYYGDELGMEGGADPDNRRGMTWSAANKDNSFLELYKKLVALRNSSPVLQSGTPKSIWTSDRDGTALYARQLDSTTAYVAINRSNTPRVIKFTPLNSRETSFINPLTGAKVSGNPAIVQLTLAPKQAAILMPLRGKSPRSSLQKSKSTKKGQRPISNQVHRSTIIHAIH